MKKFGMFLLEIGQEERQVEIMRQVLVEQPKFSPYNLFRHLNGAKSNGFISHADISEFMKINSISHNKFEAIWLIRALDHDFDDVVGYTDFLKLINHKGEFGTNQTNEWWITSKLAVDIEYAFWRLLERELEMHRKLESMKSEMIKAHKISLQQAFFWIYPEDYHKNGFWIKHLKSFLIDQWNFEVMDEELKAIFSRLDKDQDGIVSWEDFALTVLPLHIDKLDQINWMNNALESLKYNNQCDIKSKLKLMTKFHRQQNWECFMTISSWKFLQYPKCSNEKI